MDDSPLLHELRKFAKWIKPKSTYMIIYSDDADGIASAAIFSNLIDALEGYYTLVCLDKIFPEALDLIFKHYAEYYIFLDLGGPVHHYLPEPLDYERIVIIDHHEEVASYPDGLWYMNPYVYGYGGEYATSSTLTYFIYRFRMSHNPDLAAISLIGVGEVEGEIKGINWYAFTDAYSGGKAIKKIRGKKISYSIKLGEFHREITSLYKDITLVSSAGYFDDGALTAVESLIFNDYEMIRSKIRVYKEQRLESYKKGIAYLENEGLFQLDNVQWFKDPGFFKGMGTRIFDSFTSYVRYQGRLLAKNKYILGLMQREKKIPGIGDLIGDWTNIAIRVPRYLETIIDANIAQPVSALSGPIAFQLDGLGYGYKHLGSSVIPSVNEDEYIKLFNELGRIK